MKYDTNFYCWCEFHYFNMGFILFYNIQVHLDISENFGSGKITSDLTPLDKKDMSKIKCTICFSQFDSISEMEIHTEVHKKKLRCNKCNMNIENVELMKKHVDVCNVPIWVNINVLCVVSVLMMILLMLIMKKNVLGNYLVRNVTKNLHIGNCYWNTFRKPMKIYFVTYVRRHFV